MEKMRSPIERIKHPKNLAPTIQDDVLWLADGEVEQIEERIRGISVPLFLGRSSLVGLDGTEYEFRYDELFFGVSLRWWHDHPKEWRPLTETVMIIAKELEERRKKEAQAGGAHGGPDAPI